MANPARNRAREPGRAEVPTFLRAAGHGLRWRLMTELASSDLRVRELVETTGHPQNLVSYHLGLLRGAGLVTARRSSHDGRDTYYHLDLGRCADGLAAAGAALHPWLEDQGPQEDASPAGRGQVSSVLFVCTGNSARSPIAEALLRHHSGDRVTVRSGGILPKARVHPSAVRALRERFGIDLGDHVPRAVGDVTAATGARTGIGFDRVVTLCDKAREHLPQQPPRGRTHWSIADPADPSGRARRASFAAVVDDIDARVRHLIPTLDERSKR